MSYFLLYGVFALWVLLDGLIRKMAALAALWVVRTAIFGPIVLPVYLALRPLKQGEVREGGKPWNIFKNFAILWTVVMAIATLVGLISMAKGTTGLTSDAERTGAGIGMVLGMGLLAAIWFFPTMGAALLGFLLKKNSIVENGPTGPLVGHTPTAMPFGGWAGVMTAAFLGLIAVGALSVSSGLRAKASNSSKAPSESTPMASAAAGTEWVLVESVDEMDNTPIVTLTKSGTDNSTLVIRCKKHETDAFINTETVVDNGAVRIKFDQASPVRQSWTRSTDYKSLFAPDAVTFSRELASAKTFMFEFTPSQKGARLVSFNISNLAPKLQRVSDFEAELYAAVCTNRAGVVPVSLRN
jgi:hypothetical protein